MTDEQRDIFNTALIELIDASSLALKGEDEQACKVYHRIAREQGINPE